MSKKNFGVLLLTLSLLLFAAGCKKKVPPPPPPPPPPPKVEAPPPAKPPAVAEFTAEPSTIKREESSTLRWNVTDATEVSIAPGIGTVSAKGNRQVFPTETTTYTLTAKGPGGSTSGTATVTVTVPPPPPPPAVAKPTISERLATDVQDAFFDYDKSDVREDARATLTKNADALKAIIRDFPDATIVMEGHCDERGSAEYNLGLGDRRATAAKEFLTQLGVSADKLKTISYGKERPQCTESNEECWQRNRRAHFSAQ